MRSQKKKKRQPAWQGWELVQLHLSHLNIESSYVFAKIKISTSSHPHVWLLTWLCISVSWLAVWCLTLSLSDQTPVRSVSGVFPKYTVWRHHLHHSVFHCISVLQSGARWERCSSAEIHSSAHIIFCSPGLSDDGWLTRRAVTPLVS